MEIDHSELEDAGWFSREEVSRALRNLDERSPDQYRSLDEKFVFVPPKGTLSNHLIREWLEL